MSRIPYLGKLCSALGCGNRQNLESTQKGLSFHRFPMTNPELLERWLQSVNRPTLVPSRFCILCSNHFEPSCFIEDIPMADGTVRRRLCVGSVPTRNMGWNCQSSKPASLTVVPAEPSKISGTAKKRQRLRKGVPRKVMMINKNEVRVVLY